MTLSSGDINALSLDQTSYVTGNNDTYGKIDPLKNFYNFEPYNYLDALWRYEQLEYCICYSS